MKKFLPNILSISRIIFSLVMLFFKPLSSGFFIFYVISCVTDVLDGLLARKLNVCSDFGAKIDSIADFVMVTVLLLLLWRIIISGLFTFFAIAVIIFIRIVAGVIAKLRFGCFGFLHTYLNKISGAALFLMPFALLLFNNFWVFIITAGICLLSALEELLIEITASNWNPNRKSIFK